MGQPLNPQPECMDFDLLPATPLVPNPGSVRVYADQTSGQLKAIKSDGSNALPGGSPGGSNSQLQYNNAGAFGGIAESEYLPGASPALAIFATQLTFEVASGPTESNVVEVTPTQVTINATESGATLQLNSDGNLAINSNNGGFDIAAQTGSFNSAGLLQFISTAGAVLFQSGLATPRYNFASIPIFANNAAAISGGLHVGDLYRTGANPDPVCVVH